MPQKESTLTDGQAAYVLDRLVRERRISPSEVARYLADLPAEIRALEARLRSLRGEEVPSPSAVPRVQRTPQRVVRSQSSSRRATGNGKALGGMYGGLIRRIPAAEQQQYVDIKNTRGIEAAIAAMRSRKS